MAQQAASDTEQNYLDTNSQSEKPIYTIHFAEYAEIFLIPSRAGRIRDKSEGICRRRGNRSDNATLLTGTRPVIGRFDSHRLRLQRRVGIQWMLWWLTPGQWFKPYMNVFVTRNNSGSRIELDGGTPISIKIDLGPRPAWPLKPRRRLVGFSYPYDISHDPTHSASNLLTGIIILNLTAGILVLLPIIGWVLTRNHLADIVNELQRHMDLQPVE